MYSSKILVLFSLGCFLLVGCQSANNETVGTLSKPLGIEFKENDVEAPEIFNAEGLAYWDGQSSLGGVWITHPNVDQATRVLIKDKYGGKSVIGAIFNRSGDDNEKRMLLSSEAAASLGVEANENRIITVLEGNGWKFQFDEELPIEMTDGLSISIFEGRIHRIIKGEGHLKIKLQKNAL